MCEAWSEARETMIVWNPSHLLIVHSSIDDNFHLLEYKGEHNAINFCPWCGAKLPNEAHQ